MTDPYGGMSAEDVARCKASDANLAGIILGRRRAAAHLLARDPEPANRVRIGWEPVRQTVHGDDAYRAPAPARLVFTEDPTGSGLYAIPFLLEPDPAHPGLYVPDVTMTADPSTGDYIILETA